MQFCAIGALIGPSIVQHLYPIYLLVRNSPPLLARVNDFKEFTIRFENDLRNCEDIVLDEDRGVAIISCDRGRDWWNTVVVSTLSFTSKREPM